VILRARDTVVGKVGGSECDSCLKSVLPSCCILHPQILELHSSEYIQALLSHTILQHTINTINTAKLYSHHYHILHTQTRSTLRSHPATTITTRTRRHQNKPVYLQASLSQCATSPSTPSSARASWPWTTFPPRVPFAPHPSWTPSAATQMHQHPSPFVRARTLTILCA
jgi:hypothetical protein